MANEEEMKDRCIERRSLEKGEGKRDGKEGGQTKTDCLKSWALLCIHFHMIDSSIPTTLDTYCAFVGQ